jgi:hypothetical protein
MRQVRLGLVFLDFEDSSIRGDHRVHEGAETQYTKVTFRGKNLQWLTNTLQSQEAHRMVISALYGAGGSKTFQVPPQIRTNLARFEIGKCPRA